MEWTREPTRGRERTTTLPTTAKVEPAAGEVEEAQPTQELGATQEPQPVAGVTEEAVFRPYF